MEQLNRSLSKLKPPSTIVRSNSSSALSTALAVAAAAMNENENYSALTFFGNRSTDTVGPGIGSGLNSIHNEPKKDNTLTLEMLEPISPRTVTGTKRKVDDDTPTRLTRVALNTGGDKISRKLAEPNLTPQQHSQQLLSVKPGGKVPLQMQTQHTKRITPAPRPSASKTQPTNTKEVLKATNDKVARAKTSAPKLGRTHTISSAKIKAVQTQPTLTKATTGSRSATPAAAAFTTIGKKSAEIINTDVGQTAKKKRAAWDTKGRLQDMEELTSTLYEMLNKSTGNITKMTQSLESNANKISELESFRLGLESEVVDKEIENNDILQKMSTMVNRRHLDNMKSLQSQQAMEIEQQKSAQARLQQEYDTVESNLRCISNQLEQQIQETANLRVTISTQSSNCLTFESDNRALKLKMERMEDIVTKREALIEELEHQLNASLTEVEKLQQKVKDEQVIRRKLHSVIMDLKSNIRVFCRVRPHESSDDPLTVIEYPDLEGHEIVLSPEKGTRYPFTFDKVFAASSSQEDIFMDISQMLSSVISGGNACVFAYGASKSAKSFTLNGTSGSGEFTMGLIPRSLLQIYEATKAPEPSGWRYKLEVQHIWISNEIIYDLQSSEDLLTEATHEIQSDFGGKSIVSGITKMEVMSTAMISSLLRIAQRRQSEIKQSLGNKCHPGHSVFTINVLGVDPDTEKTTEGLLQFVDLVEPVCHQDVTQGSNKKQPEMDQGLRALENVFHALSIKDSQVPYRSSKAQEWE
ncbi:kinesin-like nuclear fusion protein [Linnemannia zychae]|nr:kinesin-like nuclear fusion protein [Linnemannia zychae]